jgi:hypothetical protein
LFYLQISNLFISLEYDVSSAIELVIQLVGLDLAGIAIPRQADMPIHEWVGRCPLLLKSRHFTLGRKLLFRTEQHRQ